MSKQVADRAGQVVTWVALWPTRRTRAAARACLGSMLASRESAAGRKRARSCALISCSASLARSAASHTKVSIQVRTGRHSDAKSALRSSWGSAAMQQLLHPTPCSCRIWHAKVMPVPHGVHPHSSCITRQQSGCTS